LPKSRCSCPRSKRFTGPHENGTIVHVETLAGTVAEYFEAVARAAAIPA
jgi:hypothetical protein